MEHVHESGERRSHTPPDMEVLLRTSERPEDRRDYQEKHLQLLLQEAEELNARLREQLASSQYRQPQQACLSTPIALRRGVEPSARGPPPNEARVPQYQMEPRKRRREHQMSRASPYESRPSHRTASPDGVSEAGSFGTSPHGCTSAEKTEVLSGHMARTMTPQQRREHTNPRPEDE